MAEITTLDSDRLSTFRTRHRFEHYGEFRSVEEFRAFHALARDRGLPLYILGNGSNTLFTRTRVRTLVLRNRMPAGITEKGGDRFEITAATQVIRVLKLCEKEGRDCFYFLASVPAAIGGALAMNAGAGTGPTIFDYVVDLTYAEGDEIITLTRDQIETAHRQTIFTGVQPRLILKATFAFPKAGTVRSEIRKRAHWARDHQDLASPNCGSVFRVYHGPILRRMRRMPPGGIHYPGFRTQFSRRVNNWIITRSASPRPVVFLIRAVQAVHRIFGKKAIPEIIEVG